MSPALNSALALVALVLAGLALLLATIANRRWAGRPRRAAQESGAGRASELKALEDALGVLRGQVEQIGATAQDDRIRSAGMAGEVEALRGEVNELADRADAPISDRTALRHVALVRYDAFADVGGRLSHSLALLDDTRSGLVLTTLSGKTDVRTYVRTISAGVPEGSLTTEEQQAIDAAAGSDQ